MPYLNITFVINNEVEYFWFAMQSVFYNKFHLSWYVSTWPTTFKNSVLTSIKGSMSIQHFYICFSSNSTINRTETVHRIKYMITIIYVFYPWNKHVLDSVLETLINLFPKLLVVGLGLWRLLLFCPKIVATISLEFYIKTIFEQNI